MAVVLLAYPVTKSSLTMQIPKKISEGQLVEPIHKKRMTMAIYVNPITGKEYDYPIFRVASPPVNIVFAVTEDNEVIVVRQYRHGADAILYELPGGLQDGGEDWRECIARELLEETGYHSDAISELSPGQPIYFEPGSLDFQFRPFIAFGCKKVKEQKLDAGEDIEAGIIPIDAWVASIELGTIRTDAKSLATTFLALRKIRSMGPRVLL